MPPAVGVPGSPRTSCQTKLEVVAGEREVWASLLRLPSLWPMPQISRRNGWRPGCMNRSILHYLTRLLQVLDFKLIQNIKQLLFNRKLNKSFWSFMVPLHSAPIRHFLVRRLNQNKCSALYSVQDKTHRRQEIQPGKRWCSLYLFFSFSSFAVLFARSINILQSENISLVIYKIK